MNQPNESESQERCPACDVLWIQHPGIALTCNELLKTQAVVEKLQKRIEELEKSISTYRKYTSDMEWYLKDDWDNDADPVVMLRSLKDELRVIDKQQSAIPTPSDPITVTKE